MDQHVTGNGANFGHTREDLNDLISDAIDGEHIDPDVLYIAVMRIVGVTRENKIKAGSVGSWRKIHDLEPEPYEEYPTGG
jgi:hypothetical protein